MGMQFRAYAAAAALMVMGWPAGAQDLTVVIAPVRTSFDVENQPVAITASGAIARVAHSGGQEVFRFRLTADLADLQANATFVLRSQLDRSEGCGDRIAIQNATLAPADPASLLTVRLHYERWACAKAFGRQIVKRLAGGDAVVNVKIRPSVEGNSTVKLEPEVGAIEADGSLGELLQSGSLGEMLRQRIRTSLESALEKGAANLNATLPPVARTFAAMRSVKFTDAGAGRLAVALVGEIRIPRGQVELMMGQIKQRAASR